MKNESSTKIITRYPPSPTGPVHIGNIRTALYNYLYAQHMGGEMLMRFEDTDRARSKPEYEQMQIEALEWLGLNDFHAPIRQSERGELYRSYIERLIAEDKAYESEEKPEEEGQRSSVIRFRNPNKVVAFDDVIRGRVEVDTSDLGNFVIAKSIDEPIYHLAVVIDDFEMGVTHVVRGEDHISNTPRQILIQEAIGAPRPTYAHIPLILAPDRSKLSKRHGATSLLEYKELGYLPQAMVNYLALLGWHPSHDKEIFTLEELIQEFRLEDVQKGGAVFDIEKLNWVNKEHIRMLPDEDFLNIVLEWLPDEVENLPDFSVDRLKKVLPVVKERVSTLREITEMAEAGEFEYYFERPGYFADKLLWKDEPAEDAYRHLTYVRGLLEGYEDTPTSSLIKEHIWPYAEEVGRGSVLWPLRYALSGMDRSPDPFSLIEILGIEETIARIDIALGKLDEIM